MPTVRDDFPEPVKQLLAKRVGVVCSNCSSPTSGPTDHPDKAANIGVAAHITAAAPGGPRYDETLTKDQRSDAANGIWLCQNCAKLVDNDPLHYTVPMLRNWKAKAEDAARRAIESAPPRQAALTGNFESLLRSVITQLAELPRLPGGLENLALRDIIEPQVHMPQGEPRNGPKQDTRTPFISLSQAVHQERAWLLIGEGGQGKSTALRLLAYRFAEQRLKWLEQGCPEEPEQPASFIPLYFTLSRDKIPLIEQLRASVITYGLALDPQMLERSLQTEPFLFLIDRLDETDPAPVLDHVAELLCMAPRSRLVIASRPLTLLAKWPLLQARLRPLTDPQVRRLLQMLLGDEQGGHLYGALTRQRALDPFRRPLFARLLALASTDLSNQRPVAVGRILRDVIEKRFLGALEKQSESNVEVDLVLEILAWMGWLMVRTNHQAVSWSTALKAAVTIAEERGLSADILSAEGMFARTLKQGLLERSGDDLQFWHTSFRDYFAAVWLERKNAAIDTYLCSWSPRWHEPLVVFSGLISGKSLASTIRNQLIGLRFMVRFLTSGLCISGTFACRLFLLARVLAQAGLECAPAKRRFVACLPKTFSYLFITHVAVPVSYLPFKDERGDPFRYLCDLLGQFRIPEAVDYLKVVHTDFATVAPGLVYDAKQDVIEHMIQFILAPDSEEGGWNHPRSSSPDRVVVAFLVLNSPDLRFFVELRTILTSGDASLSSRLLQTLKQTLQHYGDRTTPDYYADLEKRWTPLLIDLALTNPHSDVRWEAVEMLKALGNEVGLPISAYSTFVGALRSPDPQVRARAVSAIPCPRLLENKELAWQLLGEANIEILFEVLDHFRFAGKAQGYCRAVLKVLRCYTKSNPAWRQKVASLRAALHKSQPESRRRSRCLALLITFAQGGSFNGFAAHSVRVLSILGAPSTAPLLAKIFHSDAWEETRREALYGLVSILKTESCPFLLQGLEDTHETVRGFAAHLCLADRALGVGIRPRVGPILFRMLDDPSGSVRTTARLALEEFGYIRKDRYSHIQGPPIYLGPPQPGEE